MKMFTLVTIFLITTLVSSVSDAQPLSLGSNPQGSLAYATGAAISKVVSQDTNLKMRVVPQGGQNVTLPLLNVGELDFSLAGTGVMWEAQNGKGEFDNRQQKNVRVVAKLMPLKIGIMVREDSDIKEIKDLKGRIVASGFLKQRMLMNNTTAILATAGLTYDDVVQVPVPNGVRGVEDFESGKVDATLFSVSAGRTKQADAAVGGIRILPIPVTDEAESIIKKYTPGARLTETRPAPNIVGIKQPQGVHTQYLVLVSRGDLSDDIVYDVVKAIHENKASLVNAFGVFKDYNPNEIHDPEMGLKYHPGAIRYFNEKRL